MSIEDQRPISPAIFYQYCQLESRNWETCLDKEIIHKVFGRGRIIQISGDVHPTITVLFQQPYDGKTERIFVDKAFIGDFFSEMFLAASMVDEVTNRLQKDEQQKIDLTAVKITLGIRTETNGKAGSQPVAKKKSHCAGQKDRQVICPICSFHYPKCELRKHIREVHPFEARNPQLIRKKFRQVSIDSSSSENGETKIDQRVFYQCPYCHCAVKESKFSRHIDKVHRGSSIPTDPVRVPAPKGSRIGKSRKRKKRYVWSSPSQFKPNKRLVQLSMKMLNVGRGHRAVINRRSY